MRKTSQRQLTFPFAFIYVFICTTWVMLLYTDWLYLSFTAVAMSFLVYWYRKESRHAFELQSAMKEQDRIRIEERIRHMAYYDDFTGLPNRRFFNEQLSKALIDTAEDEDRLIAVFFIDIDRFKVVNESLGHDFGDILLMQVAERLTRHIGERDFIARLEGDEFALCYPHLKEKEDAVTIAQLIMEEIEPAFVLQEYRIHITISIGVSLHLHHEEDANQLMKYANMALSRAKELGRNNFQFHSPTMNLHSYERLTLENDLRRAMEQEEFMIYYQPQINARTGKIVGAEALLRWNHPTRGIVSPSEFVPLAEENGMIVPIGEWVLRQVCEQNKRWHDKGIHPFPVSVNLSIRQFMRQDLPNKIERILQETGLEAKYLELEITESMTMDVQHAINCLHELKSLGIGISIDDFGTGYSSLNYLKKFPINKLKIDRTFVRDIMSDPNDAAIVSTIIAMAHELGLKVIAEGVETIEQLNYLRDKNCNLVQGYLFSPPIAPDHLTKQLKLAF